MLNQKPIDLRKVRIAVYIFIFHFYVYILINTLMYWSLGVRDTTAYLMNCLYSDSRLFLVIVIAGIAAWRKNILPVMTWDRKLFLTTVIIWVNFLQFWDITQRLITDETVILIYIILGGLVVLSSWIFFYQEIHKPIKKI